MRVLVCGGAGYIGSHMVKRLLAAGHEPVVFDNFSTGHRWAAQRAFAASGQEPCIVEGDLLDKSALAGVFRQYPIDAVMHFSALIMVPESVRYPGRYYENNVTGTLNLLRAMLDAGVNQFVFSSTCAIYGEPESMPLVETMPAAPTTPYGHSKRMAEIMMTDFAAARGLKSVAMRYFNAAGADPDGSLGEEHNPESHLIPNVIKAALGQGEGLKIFGNDYPTPDGTCVRDYVHVLDLAEAHLLALEYLGAREGGVFEAFNLGTGQGTSNLEIIQSVERVSGISVPYSFAPRRDGDSPMLYAAPRKANAILGWQPRYTNAEEVVRTAWNWHSNPNRLP